MKEIKVNPSGTLEDAYKKLISEAKGQRSYIYYNGVMILSSFSLEDAYKTVYGCSKKEFELRQNRAKMIPKDDEEKTTVFDDKPSDVIRDLRVSILIDSITPGMGKDPKTDLYHSEIAKDYIIKMSKYAKYCKEEVRNEWNDSVFYYVYSVGRKTKDGELEYTDKEIEDILNIFEILGVIMKLINDGSSWSDIKAYVKSCSLSDEDTNNLIESILHYSSSGEDFVINVFGKGPMTYKNN